MEHRKVLKALKGAYRNCVMLLQETLRWEPCGDRGRHVIITAGGSNCAIAVPRQFGNAIGETKSGDNFTALQLHDVCFVSVYLPHDLDAAATTMEKIAALMEEWKSFKRLVIGGGLNVALAANHDPVTGSFVWPASAERLAGERMRRAMIMGWLSELGVRALNTFEPSLLASQQCWTWCDTRDRFSQVDFICTSSHFEGEVGVEEKLVPSDHHPVGGVLRAAEPIAVASRPGGNLVGWQPEKDDFRKNCLGGLNQNSITDSEISLERLEGMVKGLPRGFSGS